MKLPEAELRKIADVLYRRIAAQVAAMPDDKITEELVTGITEDGRFLVGGRPLAVIGSGIPLVGKPAPVLWKDGRPRGILLQNIRRAQPGIGWPGFGAQALGVVEELLLVTVSGQQRLYFRNDRQVTDLGLSTLVIGQGAPTFGVVRWGQRDDTFYLKTEQTPPRYFIFQLGRAPGAVYGAAPASARLLRVITMPTIALPVAMHTVSATPPPFASTSPPYANWRNWTSVTTPTTFPANVAILDAVLSRTDEGDVDLVVLAHVDVLQEEAFPTYNPSALVKRYSYLIAVRPSTGTILWTSSLTDEIRNGLQSESFDFWRPESGILGTSIIIPGIFWTDLPPPPPVPPPYTIGLPSTMTRQEIRLDEAAIVQWDLRAGGRRDVASRWARAYNLTFFGNIAFTVYVQDHVIDPPEPGTYTTSLSGVAPHGESYQHGINATWTVRIKWRDPSVEYAFALEGPSGRVMLSDWGEPSAILASQSRPFTPASLLWLRPATLGSAELFLTTLASGLSRMIVRDPAGIGGPFGRVSGLRLMAPDLAYAITEATASETRPAEREHFVAWPPAASAGSSFLAPTATGAAPFARAATTSEAEALRAKPADFPVDLVDFAYHAVATGG